MKDNKKILSDDQIENITGGINQVNAMDDAQALNGVQAFNNAQSISDAQSYNDAQSLIAPADLDNVSALNQLNSPLSNQASPQKNDGNRGKVNTKNPG